jgi:hypothetical protein
MTAAPKSAVGRQVFEYSSLADPNWRLPFEEALPAV